MWMWCVGLFVGLTVTGFGWVFRALNGKVDKPSGAVVAQEMALRAARDAEMFKELGEIKNNTQTIRVDVTRLSGRLDALGERVQNVERELERWRS